MGLLRIRDGISNSRGGGIRNFGDDAAAGGVEDGDTARIAALLEFSAQEILVHFLPFLFQWRQAERAQLHGFAGCASDGGREFLDSFMIRYCYGCRQPTLNEDEHPIRGLEHFENFGAKHEDTRAGSGKAAEQLIYLAFAPDIDAACRLFEQNKLRPFQDRLRDGDLLLIAPRQGHYAVACRLGFDPKVTNFGIRPRAHLGLLQPTEDVRDFRPSQTSKDIVAHR